MIRRDFLKRFGLIATGVALPVPPATAGTAMAGTIAPAAAAQQQIATTIDNNSLLIPALFNTPRYAQQWCLLVYKSEYKAHLYDLRLGASSALEAQGVNNRHLEAYIYGGDK